jgi:putative ABC transport system ATP-binding protein
MIRVEGLTKVYGKKQNTFAALTDVDLEIPDGSTVAIIGKSGSGKSTLMHIMSGLDHPTSGTVRIGNHNIHELKRKALDRFRAKEMSFIFQAFFVEANQTCYQNVVLPLEIAKVRRTKRKQLVLDALAAVDLADKINTNAKNLSGGQKQRLAIARSIVNSPKLIFADEPTGNLDSATGDLIIDLLFDLNKKLGCTIVIVTHDQELADKCQMQIQLKDGRIIKTVGPPKKKTTAKPRKVVA